MEQNGCEDPLPCRNLGVHSSEGERESFLGDFNRYRNGADPARRNLRLLDTLVNLSPSDPDHKKPPSLLKKKKGRKKKKKGKPPLRRPVLRGDAHL